MNNNFIYALLLFCNFLFYLTDASLMSAKNAAWISIICTSLVTIGVLYLASVFLKKSKCTVDFNKSKIFNIIIYLFTILKTALFVASGARLITKSFMPQSPEEYILLFFCAGLLVCLFTRKNAILTVCGFMSTVVFLLSLFICAASVKSYNFNRLFPLMGEGNYKTIISLPFLFNLANLMYFYRDNQSRVPVKSVAIATVTGVFILLGVILTRPYEMLGQGIISPVYQLSSLASIGIIFQRSEVLLLAALTFCVLTVCGYLIFEASHTFKSALSLKDAKGLSGMHIVAVYALANIFLKYDLTKLYKAVSFGFFVFAVICAATYLFINILYFKGVKSNEA